MYKIWFARNYRTYVANTLLLDNALATMGAGLPSSMMAAMMYPERRVLAVCGDGGFMKGSRVESTASLIPTLENAFKGGGVHLVVVPIDYSENTRVLVDELREKLKQVVEPDA
jgi:acetolactate synthase I/II/III large subunit